MAQEKIEGEDILAGLDQDLLSQEEINALLSGFDEEEPAPIHGMDTIFVQQEIEQPFPVNDINSISKQKHLEIQRKKEEQILLEKKRATALIRELLRMEEKRIRQTRETKDKRINEDLYARYEITCVDMTKTTVSMSEKTAEEYRLIHPGCCISKI